jgi:hypothetical protein
MRKVVVRDGDEVAMWVAGGRLSDGMVMETDFVWAPEMLLGDDSGGSAFRHAGRVDSPNVKLKSVAIFIDTVELDEPVAMDVNIDAFDVDGGAKSVVAAREKESWASIHMLAPTSMKRSSVGAVAT